MTLPFCRIDLGDVARAHHADQERAPGPRDDAGRLLADRHGPVDFARGEVDRDQAAGALQRCTKTVPLSREKAIWLGIVAAGRRCTSSKVDAS